MTPSRMRRAGLVATIALAAVAGCTTSPTLTPVTTTPPPTAPPAAFVQGSDSLGDPYAPGAGNGGYDVGNYSLKLRYDPASAALSGTATITATATENLSRFNLDLRALVVSSVAIDGVAATAKARGDELEVTPAAGLARGTTFVTTLSYAGVPKPYDEPGLGKVGFLATPDGAVAIGEPDVAASWYPVNDHPSDKATYTVAIEAPNSVSALANGVLKSKTSAAGWTTWTWVEDHPMASYLASLVIGNYRVTNSEHNGLPVVVAVASTLPKRIDTQLERTPEVIDFLQTQFGPYPFDSMGGVAIADQDVRFALENQSRPVYGPGFFASAGDVSWVLAHELAHQWYGDSVSVRDWRDIWLNEGFATYAQWLWQEHEGGGSVEQTFRRYYENADAPMWSEPAGSPATDDLFSDKTGSVYIRGGLTLHALRTAVGDAAFFMILKQWAATEAGKSATTAEFIALAEKISGKKLDALFQAWLYTAKRPAL